MQALQPNEGEVEELRGHVVIAGFGRVGQIIAQLLSERLIPFVALDVRSDRVQVMQNQPKTCVEMAAKPSVIAFIWCLLYVLTLNLVHFVALDVCSDCVQVMCLQASMSNESPLAPHPRLQDIK